MCTKAGAHFHLRRVLRETVYLIVGVGWRRGKGETTEGERREKGGDDGQWVLENAGPASRDAYVHHMQCVLTCTSYKLVGSGVNVGGRG